VVQRRHPERRHAQPLDLALQHRYAAGVERGRHNEGLHHIGLEVNDDVEWVPARVSALGARARHDIDEALVIPHDGPVKGGFRYEGAHGVAFDLSPPGVW
jgi:hypothetical protein